MSKSDIGYPDAEWLLSDGAIMGRIKRQGRPNGVTRLSLAIPLGDPVVVDVAQVDAGSMIEFCNIARNTYDERKAEQAAAQVRSSERKAARDIESGGGWVLSEEDIQAVKAPVELNVMDAKSVGQRIYDLDEAIVDLSAQLNLMAGERDKLMKVLEVLHAFEDDAKEPSGVQKEGSGEESEEVDSEPRPEELHRRGEESAERSD